MSTDNSEAIISEFAKQYRFIKYLKITTKGSAEDAPCNTLIIDCESHTVLFLFESQTSIIPDSKLKLLSSVLLQRQLRLYHFINLGRKSQIGNQNDLSC